ncbi:autotransporter outer membrane beta-barrel domain-containing protein [Roseomonas alkaliterrae]|uniref:Uncharacterized protein with beta-barrel porin domain n=1 Tax=Neoroseomonas alkaliterrae TaxID=1452450 RepID=A0A840YBG7_9PROT|nr:autotransporter outer membrane beta-barrel domain-containing protein [Neoroseomonas alkaliterrae]MBB5691892.1 uncharacterized protein with beta-barrel porin domain [Neoroseomonas alkaliterrae]MBR0677095.1 autotransporter outer membrane beta-barrel domain-containing protein [Neoroseomonas alkaliterrae]
MNTLAARLRGIAMASTALMALPMLAAAQDATWTGPGTSLLDPANWSTGAVPTGTATFAGASPLSPTIVSLSPLNLGELRFVAGAPAYVVTLGALGPPSSGGVIRLTGAGISDLSGQARFDLVLGQIALENQASLGSAVIGSGTSGATRREVVLLGNARGGTARLDNVALLLRENASAERLVLNGELNALENSTLADATITIAALSGTTRASLVAGNASLGAARITIADGPNNLLRVAQNATGGTAAVTVLGAGRFDLSLMTLPTFTIGSLAGDGRVLLGERTLVLDGPGGTFAGAFEGGSGSGVTFARGTITLTGTSTLTGNFLVNPGATLLVDGNTQSVRTTFVNAGGTLGGTGTVGRVFLDGTLSPGNAASPIGTLAVQGNLAMGPGATLRVDVAASGADRVTVSGIAALDGTLQVVPDAGALPANGQTYTIVQAGSVQGAFAAVNDPLAYFDFTPVYSGTQVNLVATQLPFNNPAATGGVRNLVQQSGALDAYRASVTSNADFNAFLGQLLRLAPGATTNALHSMSGEAYASFTTVGLEQLDRFRYAALDAAGSCEGRGGEMRGRWCAWADAYYVSASLDGSGDLAGFDYTLSGVQGGVEMRVRPDAVVGFTLGYGEQRMRNFDFAPRRLTGDALFAGIYGTYGMGPWQAVGLVGYTRFDVDGERDITVGSIGRQARSNFGADGVNAAVALRYRMDLGGFRVEPELLLAYTQYWQEGFTESGAGSLNLRVNGTDANSFVTGIGVRASTEFTIEGRTVRPFAVLRYEHDWLAGEKEDHRVNASFAAVPEAGSWTVFGQNRGRENVIGRLGVVGEVTSNVALFGTVGGQLNANGSEWGVGGGVRVTF